LEIRDVDGACAIDEQSPKHIGKTAFIVEAGVVAAREKTMPLANKSQPTLPAMLI